jgi:chromate transporter
VVHATPLGLIRADIPAWSSIDFAALLLSAGALVAMLRFRLGMGWTLLGSAALGALWVYHAG